MIFARTEGGDCPRITAKKAFGAITTAGRPDSRWSWPVNGEPLQDAAAQARQPRTVSPGQAAHERGLSRRANYARWIEYSVSTSVMIVLIGLFVGIRDLATVIAIFAATISPAACGPVPPGQGKRVRLVPLWRR